MNYTKEVLRYVTFGANNYVFGSNVPSTVNNDLGHTIITNTAPVNGFINANSPKPPRATQRTATGTNTSWASAEKLPTLRNTGWTIQQPKTRNINLLNGSKRVVTVYVVTGGIKYAWNMPKELHAKISTFLSGLGIELATANDIPNLIWGASAPKPALATLFVEGGEDGNDIHTTFCSQASEDNLPTGWQLKRPRLSLQQYLFGTLATEQL